MKNLHVLEIKYLGPTNFKGTRVSIFSARFKQRIIIPYDYSLNSIQEMAQTFLESKGFNILGCGEGKVGMYIISDTFKPLKP